MRTILEIIIETQSRHGYPIGLKVSGGIKTTMDAASYLDLADELLGSDWPRPDTLRFGASALLNDLLLYLSPA